MSVRVTVAQLDTLHALAPRLHGHADGLDIEQRPMGAVALSTRGEGFESSIVVALNGELRPDGGEYAAEADDDHEQRNGQPNADYHPPEPALCPTPGCFAKAGEPPKAHAWAAVRCPFAIPF